MGRGKFYSYKKIRKHRRQHRLPARWETKLPYFRHRYILLCTQPEVSVQVCPTKLFNMVKACPFCMPGSLFMLGWPVKVCICWEPKYSLTHYLVFLFFFYKEQINIVGHDRMRVGLFRQCGLGSENPCGLSRSLFLDVWTPICFRQPSIRLVETQENMESVWLCLKGSGHQWAFKYLVGVSFIQK